MRRLFIFLMLFPSFVFAENGNREGFLLAWENFQKQNDLVETFKKVDDQKYFIKFKSLPYEGELTLLTYDIDEIKWGPSDSVYTKTGYVEIDLPGAIDNLMQKYGRTFQRWSQSNMLYYDAKSSLWVTAEEYATALKEDALSTGDQIIFSIFDYWSYALMGIILYFLWSTIVNNKRTKAAIKQQEQMITKSLTISEESLNLQRQSIEKSIELHNQTNQYLMGILNELKKEKM